MLFRSYGIYDKWCFCLSALHCTFVQTCCCFCFRLPMRSILQLCRRYHSSRESFFSFLLEPNAAAHRFLARVDTFRFSRGHVEHVLVLYAAHYFTMSGHFCTPFSLALFQCYLQSLSFARFLQSAFLRLRFWILFLLACILLRCLYKVFLLAILS